MAIGPPGGVIGVVVIRGLWVVGITLVAGNEVVDSFGASGDVGPTVHHADLLMKPLPSDSATLFIPAHQQTDSFAGGTDKIILFGLCKDGHMARQDFRDATDTGADNQEVATCGFNQDCAKGLGQTWMQVDVAAHHDVADFFVSDGAEQCDAVVQDVSVEHLLEVDGFGARAGNDEAHVWMGGQDARDGSNEQIGALVVEEARDDDNGDCVVWAQ